MDDMLVVQVRLQPGYAVSTVAGEVDIATAPQLGQHLAALAGSGRPVIADLDQVSFIDAAGLRVLAAAARQAADSGGSLHVVSARYQVRRVFALTVSGVSPVEAGLKKAVAVPATACSTTSCQMRAWPVRTSTATVPLSMSPMRVAAASPRRPVRSTLVAPILPDPMVRMSVVPANRVSSSPNGIEPSRYPKASAAKLRRRPSTGMSSGLEP